MSGHPTTPLISGRGAPELSHLPSLGAPARPSGAPGGRSRWRAGVDTGGTFTDVVLEGPSSRHVAKVSSEPADPSRAVLAGLLQAMDRAGLDGRHLGEISVVHGSTVATNAVLERSGARTALVVTRGFEDLLRIGRQTRPDLYDLEPQREPSLVEPGLSRGVVGRMGPEGEELEPLEDDETLGELARDLLRSGAEAVALCLLHAYANPEHEKKVASVLASAGLSVSCSAELVGEYREVERASTVVANAYVADRMGGYLRRLSQRLPELSIMLSSGGAASVELAAREPVRTLLSGPAGGVIAARETGRRVEGSPIVAFDMGGTSTDVALGGVDVQSTLNIGGITLRTPVLGIHTVGAGGGSIASIDAGGALRVGPRSAGAHPGPICYGRGGREVTVTDANLALGRLAPRLFLAGGMKLDSAGARRGVEALARDLGEIPTAEAALGVLRVARATMARAVRQVTVARGLDHREHDLVAFGGAGPMHAADLADELGMARVWIPRDPGALSADGMLSADAERRLARTVLRPANKAGLVVARETGRALLVRARSNLATDSSAEVQEEITLDMRYCGQSHEIGVPWLLADPTESFEEAYEARYGAPLPGRAVEIVAVRVRAWVAPPVRETSWTPDSGGEARVGAVEWWHATGSLPASVWARRKLVLGQSVVGPALLTELSATTVVPEGWRARVVPSGDVLLEHVEGA